LTDLEFSSENRHGRDAGLAIGGDGMKTTLTLIDLAGAIALLIWGVHMVQTG
jgi:hypothetical protein